MKVLLRDFPKLSALSHSNIFRRGQKTTVKVQEKTETKKKKIETIFLHHHHLSSVWSPALSGRLTQQSKSQKASDTRKARYQKNYIKTVTSLGKKKRFTLRNILSSQRLERCLALLLGNQDIATCFISPKRRLTGNLSASDPSQFILVR